MSSLRRFSFTAPLLSLLLLSALSSASSSSPEILNACQATRNPVSCADRLSNSTPPLPPNATASDIILTIFNTSLSDLLTARSAVQSILDNSPSDLNRTNAARICLQVLSYSTRRLSAATFSDLFSPDSRAWAGAALLYQYDCWSALKYVNGTSQVAAAMTFLSELSNRTSDGLSMLAALHRYGPNITLWGPPQTERDGYWDPPSVIPAIGVAGGVPVDLRANSTVCKDGECDFKTVQEAVDAAPANLSGPGKRFVIRIKAGLYDEIVRVPFEKTNLVFVGDGMGKTVITGDRNADQVGVTTYSSATVAVAGDGFMARDLTFQNTAGPAAHQAVAFRSDADFTILDTVEFSGHQDTLYSHSLRQYYKSCLISGTVDFIFGNSAAVFDDCLIVIVTRQFNPMKGESDTITAQGRTDPAQPTGFVFHNCRLNASEEYWNLYRSNPSLHRVYLGRPWKEYSRTVFIGCYMEEFLRPEGWLEWSEDFALETLFYGEFGSRGPGGNVTARVWWSNQIPAEHVGVYSVDNFIQGNQWIPAAECL
ncbi:probable pectinesterase/pectinesterase inhibitor 51 [Phalaenopsis equestris]|uniref:probable pectinesterase/pectinesterase inhibitor 51 n=1 Tax=Phalaenopsis equestris TaxID=78828 RepID=UPI0009E60964|nr:probable pectinesterase/pectinesterase inhibitor 51 [Phalaenopsis equestris]